MGTIGNNGNSKFSKWSWVFPGGTRENNEETIQTVIREAKEEFNIVLAPDQCDKIDTSAVHSGIGSNEIWLCRLNDIPRPLIISESAGWFTLEQINKMDLGFEQSELVLPIINEKYNAY